MVMGGGSAPSFLLALTSSPSSALMMMQQQQGNIAMQCQEGAHRGERIVHFNNAGASPSAPGVVDRVAEHLHLETRIGGYRAAATEEVREELSGAYDSLARLLGAQEGGGGEEIALVESATVAWTRLFYSFVQHQHRRHQKQQQKLKKKKRLGILMSQVEYAANLVAACQWARRHSDDDGDCCSWTVRMIPSTTTGVAASGNATSSSTGVVDVEALRRMLEVQGEREEEEVALVCVTHIPTNSGVVNPVEEIGRVISEHNQRQQQQQPSSPSSSSSPSQSFPNVLYLVDACQSVGQRVVDVQKIQCHGLVGTGRKYLRGPRGTGFLYVDDRIVESLWPDHLDHYAAPIASVPPPADTINPSNKNILRPNDNDDDDGTANRGNIHGVVDNVQDVLSFAPRPGAKRFEFWESNIASRLGLGRAVAFALGKGLSSSNATATEIIQLARRLYDQLQQMDSDRVVPFYPPESGLVTFGVKGMDAQSVCDHLWEQQQKKNDDGAVVLRFEVSVVPATSTPLDSSIAGVSDLVRASISYTNTIEDVDLFCDRLSSILANQP